MMLTYTITAKTLIFEWPSDLRVKEVMTHTCLRNRKHTVAQTQILAEAAKVVCARLSETSYGNIFSGLSVLVNKLPDQPWPAHDDVDNWQKVIVTLFERTIQAKGVSLETRIAYWAAAVRILKAMARMGVMPQSVIIPSVKGNLRGGERGTAPVGFKRKKIPPAVEIEGVLPKSFIIERDLHIADDLFLSQFKAELETSMSLIANALDGYWTEMIETHEIGKKLIETIPVEIRDAIINNNGIGIDGVHVCAKAKSYAFESLLLLAKHKYETGQINAITATEISRTSTGLNLERIKRLFRVSKAICPQKYLKSKISNEFTGRLIGLLSTVDCNAAVAILIINNPVFTSESIGRANLLMDNGDCYVQVDTEDGVVRFSVSKPRSMSRKVAHLNKVSCEVLSKIIECTASTRKLLFTKKRRNWKRLFLYVAQKGPAANPGQISNNNSIKNSLRNRLISDLNSIRGSLDISPKALRATQGIITFLRTGSLALTAMVLGNTLAVAKSNYVPGWLVKRFTNRTLRILAQKVIVVATHGYPWALAASDCTTSEDLHLFIVRILTEATGNDPFSKFARKRLDKNNEFTSKQTSKSGDLYLHMDNEVLAALYAYESKVSTLPEDEQLRIHPETNLSHKALCNIASLSRLAAELDIETASEADLKIANNFCGDSLDEIKGAHKQALAQADYFHSLFSNIRATAELSPQAR